jgi:uncharacterized damage-inducible protein DinB
MEITAIDSFLEHLGKVRGRTRRVAACIPPERVEWSYAPGKFSCGDLLRHVAGLERWMFVENVLGRPSRYPGHGPELAPGLDATLAYLDRLHQESVALLAPLSAADLQRPCTTPGGAAMRAWKWLRLMVEHEIHHRGQLYLYLAALGVATPPLYGLTAEEVRARSIA